MRFLPIWKARKVGAVMGNNPPFTITEKAADYLAKIAEIATRLEFDSGFKRDIKLHRENRVRTIYSSLAIEGNLLSLGEVAAVIDGKPVAGRQADVKEVKNAYAAYDKIMTFNPYSISDFLKAHKLTTGGLITESGKFRSRREIFALINKSSASRSFSRDIKPLILCGFVEIPVPDKPNSSLQKHQLTDIGKERVIIAKRL